MYDQEEARFAAQLDMMCQQAGDAQRKNVEEGAEKFAKE